MRQPWKELWVVFSWPQDFWEILKKIYCKDDRLGIVDWTYLFIYFFDTLKFIDYLVPKWPFEIVACTFSFFFDNLSRQQQYKSGP